MREYIAYHCFYGTLEHMGHIVRNSAGVMEHPLSLQLLHTARGDAILPRGHVQISPIPGSKHFQKSSQIFQPLNRGCGPRWDQNYRLLTVKAGKKPRNKNVRKKNARWRERRPKKLQTVLLLHNGTGRGATSCCKTETTPFQ